MSRAPINDFFGSGSFGKFESLSDLLAKAVSCVKMQRLVTDQAFMQPLWQSSFLRASRRTRPIICAVEVALATKMIILVQPCTRTG